MLLAHLSLSTSSVLSGATQDKLQSDLQVVAACAGSAVAQMRPSYDPRPAAASAGLEPLSKKYGAREARCFFFERI